MQNSIKKISYIAFLIMAVFLLGCDTENNVTPRSQDLFIKFYGGGTDYQAVDFQPDPVNGGYIILANAGLQENEDSSRMVMIRVDEFGNEQERAELTFDGGITRIEGNSLEIIPEGYLVGATAYYYQNNDSSAMLVAKYSGVGALIQYDTLTVPDNSHYNVTCSRVNLDNDGTSYLVSGSGKLIERDVNNNPLFTEKTQTVTYRLFNDLSRDPAWIDNIISGPLPENVTGDFRSVGLSLLPTTSPNSYFVFGTTDRPEDQAFGDQDTFFSRRFFLNGQSDLEENFGNPQEVELMKSVIRITDSDYMMIGNTSSTDGEVHVSIAKFDGNILNETVSFNFQSGREGDLEVVSGNLRSDGRGYLLTGEEIFSETTSDVFLASTAGDGWYTSFGFEGRSSGVKVFQNEDGSIMLLATVSTLGATETRKRIALIKTNSNGELKN